MNVEMTPSGKIVARLADMVKREGDQAKREVLIEAHNAAHEIFVTEIKGKYNRRMRSVVVITKRNTK